MNFEDNSKLSTQSSQSGPTMDIPVLSMEDMEEMSKDPHGVLRKYRNMCPVVSSGKNTYIVLRHADIQYLGKDPRLCSLETTFAEMLGITSGGLFQHIGLGMLMANGETHRRRRSPCTKPFLRQTVEDIRPIVRQEANRLIDSWYMNGQVEFIEEFSARLPSRIISDFIGFPRSDSSYLSSLADEMGKYLNTYASPDDIANAESGYAGLKDYVEQKIAERRKHPCDDFLSVFLAANDESSQLSQPELVSQIITLIIGGTDTTRAAIAIAVALLLQHPEQWEAICRDPRLIPDAVAESMRYEPTATGLIRKALEDIHVDSMVIPANAVVSLSAMSAMRDEQVYDRPDIFNIYREKRDRVHPVFGAGVHRCLGEALARIEQEEALAVLSARIPHVQLNYQPRIIGYSGLRRIDTMGLSWTN